MANYVYDRNGNQLSVVYDKNGNPLDIVYDRYGNSIVLKAEDPIDPPVDPPDVPVDPPIDPPDPPDIPDEPDDIPIVGEIASRDVTYGTVYVITVTTETKGQYTLRYLDENNNPIAGWKEICTDVVQ